MHLFAETTWNDFLTIGGFVVGIVGFAATLWQLRETTRAAKAAEEAAKKTLTESKDAFERFVAAFASRLLSELQTAEDNKDWLLANLRTHDLAELLGTIDLAEVETTRLVARLREFEQKFADRKAERNPKFSQVKWDKLVNDLHALLDRLRAPFRLPRQGEINADDTTGNVQGNRDDAAGENQARPGELDAPEGLHAE